MNSKMATQTKSSRAKARVAACISIFILTTILIGSSSVLAQTLDWARNDGGASMDSAGPIVIDALGNSYVAGYFEGTATFGADQSNETTLTSEGESDQFIASYDISGSLRWVQRIGAFYAESIGGLALGQDGILYLAGHFSHEITLESQDGNNTTLEGNGSWTNLFIARYDTDGNLLWARHDGGWGRLNLYGITVGEAGEIYLTGVFDKPTTFGLGDPNITFLTNLGDHDAFVAAYDGQGSLRWARQAGGTIHSYGSGIAVDQGGDVFVSGSFRGTSIFGSEGDEPITLISDGTSYTDIFVARYDADGEFQWARRDGGEKGDYGRDIVLDEAGNSYVTGLYREHAIFGSGEPHETELYTVYHRSNLYIAAYDPDGHLLWVIGGSEASCGASDIVRSASGDFYLTGSVETHPYSGPVVFGLGEAHELALDGFGESDILVARYASDGSFLDAWLAGGIGDESAYGIAVDENDVIYLTGGFKYPITFDSGGSNETTLISNGDNDLFVARYRWPTPIEQIEELIEDIQELIDSGDLNQGQGNAFIAKLEAAVNSLENENTEAAIGQLQAFINAVEAAIQSEKLTPEEGQPLIDAVQDLIDSLES